MTDTLLLLVTKSLPVLPWMVDELVKLFKSCFGM